MEHEPKFDNNTNLSIFPTKKPIKVLDVRNIEVKNSRVTIVDEMTCLWDNGATNSMIKTKRTKS